jgi:hypothetical protein
MAQKRFVLSVMGGEKLFQKRLFPNGTMKRPDVRDDGGIPLIHEG